MAFFNNMGQIFHLKNNHLIIDFFKFILSSRQSF